MGGEEERSTRQIRHVMSKEEARKFSSILSLLYIMAFDHIHSGMGGQVRTGR